MVRKFIKYGIYLAYFIYKILKYKDIGERRVRREEKIEKLLLRIVKELKTKYF